MDDHHDEPCVSCGKRLVSLAAGESSSRLSRVLTQRKRRAPGCFLCRRGEDVCLRCFSQCVSSSSASFSSTSRAASLSSDELALLMGMAPFMVAIPSLRPVLDASDSEESSASSSRVFWSHSSAGGDSAGSAAAPPGLMHGLSCCALCFTAIALASGDARTLHDFLPVSMLLATIRELFGLEIVVEKKKRRTTNSRSTSSNGRASASSRASVDRRGSARSARRLKIGSGGVLQRFATGEVSDAERGDLSLLSRRLALLRWGARAPTLFQKSLAEVEFVGRKPVADANVVTQRELVARLVRLSEKALQEEGSSGFIDDGSQDPKVSMNRRRHPHSSGKSHVESEGGNSKNKEKRRLSQSGGSAEEEDGAGLSAVSELSENETLAPAQKKSAGIEHLEAMSVSMLKQILEANNIDYADCVERRDLVDKIRRTCPHVVATHNLDAMLEVDDHDLCVICMDNRINTVMVPCGHFCICHPCARELSHVCPICRSHVQMVQRIYHANQVS